MKKSTSNPITMGFALIESILIKLSMQIQLIGLDVCWIQQKTSMKQKIYNKKK